MRVQGPAIEESGSPVDAKAKGDGQRRGAARLQVLLQGGDDLHAPVSERAVDDERDTALQPLALGEFEIAKQREAAEPGADLLGRRRRHQGRHKSQTEQKSPHRHSDPSHR